MTTNRWRRIEALYLEILACPLDARATALAKASEGDVALQAEVQSLLDQAEPAGGFLATPAMELAARLVAPASSLLPIVPGTRLGPYEIEELLGEGGMGRVFRARDTRLGRAVAIKVCQEGFSGRFEREARSIAALNHPHVCTLYDVGPNYLVMELVEGETLASVLEKGPRPVDQALLDAAQIAEALAAAHALGIVHRDLTPGNVMITPTGVKVLDFGLAKRATTAGGHAEATAVDVRTAAGQIVGTSAYMSPEQVEGKPVDARSDVFAFGVVLYEMLCGRRPFKGETTLAALASTLRSVPDPPRNLRKEIPESAGRIVMRCLEKKPEARYGSARELHRDLVALRAARTPGTNGVRAALIAVGLTVLAGAAAGGVRSYMHVSRAGWVERDAVPEIIRLINENRRLAALKLFRQAVSYAPASTALFALAESVGTARVSFETTPAGARVYVSDYTAAAGDDLGQWQLLGETPFETEQLPVWGYYRLRALKEGFAPVERALFLLDDRTVQLTLHGGREVPPGMTWVPGGAPPTPAPAAEVPGFWMDTYEVSNREFKAFVDAGGYGKQDYWTHEILKDGHAMSWADAMNEFRDATRRPGPAGWQLGAYAEGAEDLPVGGVSWYEAAAYSEFLGKSLPTVYEWFAAAGISATSDILPLSNFGGRGPTARGASRGMARFGSYDMAGNVKEWVANPRGELRYVLGGAWDEAEYVFSRFDARPPFSREPTAGFRLVRRVSPLPEAASGPVAFAPGVPRRSQPVDDKTFRIFIGLHAYDRTELDPKVERVTESPEWRRETVTFRAAYGAERVIAHLFLPGNATPPYQIVAFFGHSGILATRRIEDLQLPYQFVLRSGRALIVPAYSGSLERGPSPHYLSPIQTRERLLKWAMDLGRSIDYLETRPDINTNELGFLGVSMGAANGARLVAVDPRFKTAVLASGGLYDDALPEVDAWNFAPRVRIPVLMLNGRNDFIFPMETHQKPLFEALGTQKPDKVFRQYDGGHANLLTRPDLMGEILDWLDRYLGPVHPRDARR